MSSKLPAAKKQRTMETRSTSLKQGTLSFGSSKRAGSGTSSGSKDEKEKLKRQEADRLMELPLNGADAPSPIEVDESSNDSDARVDEVSEEERYEVAPSPVKKRTKKALPVKAKAKKASAKKGEEEDIEDADELGEEVKEEPRKTLNMKIIKPYQKHYEEVREKMGFMKPIHAEGQTKYHEILRVFDFEYKYGPCVGMSRLERWERASNLGLKPPREVREILTTKEGIEREDLAQCVLYGEV